MTLSTCRLIIDTRVIRHNYTRQKEILTNATSKDGSSGSPTIMPVVKADGYGVGSHKVTETLLEAGAREFFVATLWEGIALREHFSSHGPDFTIYVLEGFLPHAWDTFIKYRLSPVLSTHDQIEHVSAYFAASRGHERGEGIPMGCILQVDTGMNRLGLSVAEAHHLLARKGTVATLPLRYIISHLACAETPDHPFTHHQVRQFLSLRQAFPQYKYSLLASEGVASLPNLALDGVRLGFSLYAPPLNPKVHPTDLRQAVTLQAQVLQLATVAAGEPIGYNATYRTSRDSMIATLAIGFADGLNQALSNTGHVLITGADGRIPDGRIYRAPIVGRISMDLTTVDVTDLPKGVPSIGDWVTCLGDPTLLSPKNIPPKAGKGNTDIGPQPSPATISIHDWPLSPYQALTHLSRRAQRIYL